MIDTIIVSGGDIQCDFALDFLKKYTENVGKKIYVLLQQTEAWNSFWIVGLCRM